MRFVCLKFSNYIYAKTLILFQFKFAIVKQKLKVGNQSLNNSMLEVINIFGRKSITHMSKVELQCCRGECFQLILSLMFHGATCYGVRDNTGLARLLIYVLMDG